MSTSDGSMSFLEHLGELRIRLIRFLIVFAICVLGCYAVRKELLDLIKSPVEIPLRKYSTHTTKTVSSGTTIPDLRQYDCQCRPVFNSSAKAKPVSEKKTEKTPAVSGARKNFGQRLLDSALSLLDLKKEAPASSAISSPQETAPPEKLSCECQAVVQKAVVSDGSPMVYLGLPELFFSQMKTAIFAGLFLSFPFLIIQAWGFVGPALYRSEKKVFWWFALSTYICFIGGALFGYFVVFPFGFDFFLSLTEPGKIVPSLSIGQYLNLAIKLLISFGVIFELPLMAFILARLGILTPQGMLKQFRMALLVICIISALLTPPDPFTMLLMAGPLLILYSISILVCFLGQNKQKAALRAQGLDE